MVREYRLTDEEYRQILAALKYAKANAVSEPERFGVVQTELIQQSDHHDTGKNYRSDRFQETYDQ